MINALITCRYKDGEPTIPYVAQLDGDLTINLGVLTGTENPVADVTFTDPSAAIIFRDLICQVARQDRVPESFVFDTGYVEDPLGMIAVINTGPQELLDAITLNPVAVILPHLRNILG